MSAPRPILLHGVVGGPSAWTAQDGRFPGAAAIAMPGRAVGAPMDRLEDAVVFVAELLERVPGPRVLVGHDLGAAIALEVAVQRPRVLDGVIAIACGPTLPFPGVVLTHLEDDPEGQIDRLMRASFRDPRSDVAVAVREVLEAGGAGALTADVGLARQVDLRGRLAGVRVPVLLVAGGDDPVTPPSEVAALAAEIPVCDTVLVPGARHLVMADAPRSVDLLLAAFLARLELTLDGA